jgi:2-iminobutanoate/2-iminopropanoate deaminase
MLATFGSKPVRGVASMSAFHHRNTLAAEPLDYLSHAVGDGRYVFLSGQLAADKAGGAQGLGDTAAETRIAMELLGGALAEFGLDYADLMRVNIYMTDLGDLDRMNEVYSRFFEAGRMPARTCVGVAALIGGGKIEIDGVARLREGAGGQRAVRERK